MRDEMLGLAASTLEMWMRSEEMHCAPVNLQRFARWLGYSVTEASLPALRGLAGNGRILLNSSLSPTRRQWTLAHEIAEHLVPVRDSLSHERREYLCQAMAAVLVFPAHLWRDAVQEFGGDLPALAERFRASWEATARRMRDHFDAWLTIAEFPRDWGLFGFRVRERSRLWDGTSEAPPLSTFEREQIAAAPSKPYRRACELTKAIRPVVPMVSCVWCAGKKESFVAYHLAWPRYCGPPPIRLRPFADGLEAEVPVRRRPRPLR